MGFVGNPCMRAVAVVGVGTPSGDNAHTMRLFGYATSVTFTVATTCVVFTAGMAAPVVVGGAVNV